MISIWHRLNDLLVRGEEGDEVASQGWIRLFILKSLRILYLMVQEFFEGQLILRAMGLAYTTLLSLVPLLAVSFSVLKAFGVHNQFEPLLHNFLLPLGAKGEEITQRIIEFVENMKVGVLGSIGLVFLIYTIISLIHEIEEAFNYIWKITRPRSFTRRFSDYMSIILVGPVLIFSAIGLTASIMSTTIVQKMIAIEPLGTAVAFAGKSIPYIFVCFAFTFIYIFIPNIKIKLGSALVGGILAGVLWETTGWIFASFVVSSTRYMAIYSGFAILILFIVWLYLSWLILLVGAKISFYHQHPAFITVKREELLMSNRVREKLALSIMYHIGHSYYHRKEPWTLDSLVDHFAMPLEPVQELIMSLERKGLIVESGDDPPGYLPARDLETITLRELFNAVRLAEEETSSTGKRLLSFGEVEGVMEGIDDAINDTLGERTLKDLILSRREEA
ncbi:MAG: YhjD/YihY/BrkB family envelope integrity protein [Thermodesulfobacteriota bacterium]